MTRPPAPNLSRVKLPAVISRGRRYVQYVNKTCRRTGSLWVSRHKSWLFDSGRYLLVCQRYSEINPVRAATLDDPARGSPTRPAA